VIVTISNQYGSGALAVAARAARALGYRFVDRQLPVVVAKRLHITPEAVEASEDSRRTLGERLVDSLERATPETAQASAAEPLDEELLAAVAAAVREYAAKGSCVIVGRGAFAILGARPDVLRVFMRAPREWRVAHVMETTHVPRDLAEGEIDRVDRARTAYIRQWYGLSFGDPQNYDLCIDTSRLDAAQSAASIVAAVQARA
jgi:cytidylate kinase